MRERDKKKNIITIRVTDSEFDDIYWASTYQNLGLGPWCRQTILSAVRFLRKKKQLEDEE